MQSRQDRRLILWVELNEVGSTLQRNQNQLEFLRMTRFMDRYLQTSLSDQAVAPAPVNWTLLHKEW